MNTDNRILKRKGRRGMALLFCALMFGSCLVFSPSTAVSATIIYDCQGAPYTITEDTELWENLERLDCTGQTGSIFIFGANGTTLYGNNRTIIAPDAGDVIYIDDKTAVTVQDLVITGGNRGILAVDSNYVNVSNVDVTVESTGIELYETYNSLIEDGTVDGGAYDVMLWHVAGAMVQNMTLADGGFGIWATDVYSSKFYYNTITDSATAIFLGAYSSGNLIRYNTISDNTNGIAIMAINALGNGVQCNTITENEVGVRLNQPDWNTNLILQNNIFDNTYKNMYLNPSATADVIAQGNYWALKNKKIDEEIYDDEETEGALGKVDYSGWQHDPLACAP